MSHVSKNTKNTLISALILSATAPVYANDLPAPMLVRDANEQAQRDFRDNLQQIQKIEEQKREDAGWQLQQNQQANPTASPSSAEGMPKISVEQDLSKMGSSENPNPNSNLVSESKSKSESESQSEPKIQTEKACLDYSGIELTGITLINQNAIRAKIPTCIHEDSLNQLSKDIVSAYMQQGYPHTQIQIEEGNQNDKILRMKVLEGRIREIKGKSRRVNVAMLFPHHEDKPLNIQYLDQGIEQANKLTGNQVSMDIYPHSDGTASVELHNEESRPWTASLTLDNSGSQKIPVVARANIGVASPLGLSDSLYMGGFMNARQGTNHYSRGGNAFYTVPYGAWTFSAYASGSRSQSITEFEESDLSFAYRSQSNASGVKAERVISRGQKHITSVSLGGDYLSSKSTFGGSLLKLQSPKIRSGQVGVSHTQIVENGMIISDLNLERGVAKDVENTPFDKKYATATVSSTLIKNRFLKKWAIRNQHRFAAQYSQNELFATKQFDIVGRSSVRGFRSMSLNANRGAYLNNTVSFRRNLPKSWYIEPSVGLDLGVVKDDEGWQRALGLSAGMTVGQYGSGMRLSVDWGRGFARTTGTQGSNRQEQVMVSFTMSV